MAMNTSNDTKRGNLGWVAALLTALLCFLWYGLDRQGTWPVIAAVAGIGILFATVVLMFRRTQEEARVEAAAEFGRLTGALRARIEALESRAAPADGGASDETSFDEALDALHDEFEALKKSLAQDLEAEKEERVRAIEAVEKKAFAGAEGGAAGGADGAALEALRAEVGGRADELAKTAENLVSRLDAAETGRRAIDEALAAVKKDLAGARKELADAIDEAVEAEGELRAKAIATVSRDVNEALEAERSARLDAIKKALASVGVGSEPQYELDPEYRVPREEELLTACGEDGEDGEDSEDSEDAGDGGDDGEAAEPAPAAKRPKAAGAGGKKGRKGRARHRGKS